MKIRSLLATLSAALALTLHADVLDVTESNFSEMVEQSTQPVVLDIYATWCPPCRRMAPILEQASLRFPNIRFVKVDFDANPDIAQRYGVKQLPTILFIAPGKADPVIRSTGLLSDKALDEKIAQLSSY